MASKSRNAIFSEEEKLLLAELGKQYPDIENRLRVVSNFGGGDCEVDEIHTHARNLEETRREGSAEN